MQRKKITIVEADVLACIRKDSIFDGNVSVCPVNVILKTGADILLLLQNCSVVTEGLAKLLNLPCLEKEFPE